MPGVTLFDRARRGLRSGERLDPEQRQHEEHEEHADRDHEDDLGQYPLRQPAMPVKPRTPAMSEITKNSRASFNMMVAPQFQTP
jgi:hypothetical protein